MGPQRLGDLAAGTAFVTDDGRLGIIRPGTHRSGLIATWMAGPQHNWGDGSGPANALVLPLDPDTLRRDLDELDGYRLLFHDGLLDSEELARREQAKERSRCAAELRRVAPTLAATWDRAYEAAAQRLDALGPAPAPELAATLAAKVGRLRAALEKIAKLDGGNRRSADIARKALEEE